MADGTPELLALVLNQTNASFSFDSVGETYESLFFIIMISFASGATFGLLILALIFFIAGLVERLKINASTGEAFG